MANNQRSKRRVNTLGNRQASDAPDNPSNISTLRDTDSLEPTPEHLEVQPKANSPHQNTCSKNEPSGVLSEAEDAVLIQQPGDSSRRMTEDLQSAFRMTVPLRPRPTTIRHSYKYDQSREGPVNQSRESSLARED